METSSNGAASTTTTAKLNGFAAQSPQAILAAMCEAMLPLNSVTVETTFSKPTTTANMSAMQWRMSNGADTGTISYLLNKKSVGVQVYLEPYTSFIKAPAAWWSTTSVAAEAANYADKWIAIGPNSDGMQLIAPLLPYSNLTSMLDNCTEPERTPTKGSLSSVGQNQTIEVQVNGGFVVQTYFVPTLSAPFLLKSTRLGATGLETARLSAFNSTTIPAAPSGAVPFENPGAPTN